MHIILHICCGVCAAGVVETLVAEGHRVTGYFYNPNIHPAEEYHRRLATAEKVAQELNFRLEVAPYTPKAWLKETEPLKTEPEGGSRCQVCFRIRLGKTYQYLSDLGADAFTTTLTISPSKSAEAVNKTGWEIGGSSFLARDFKKKEGFKRATQLAKKWELYRQNYCGCIYSMR